VINGGVYMATITVSSNPSTTGDTLTVNFTTDATNISDILLSKDGGSTYISATSFTNSSAVFNISNWDNGTYNNCKLKCVYTETSSGGGEVPDNSWEVESPSNSFIVTTDFGGNTSPLMRNEKCTYTAGGMTMGTGSYSVIDKYMSCDLWRMEAEVEVLDKSSVFGFLTEPIINGVPTSSAQKGALMLFDSGYIRLYDHYTGYFKIPTTVRAQTPFTIETGKKYKIKGQKHGWIYTFTITDTTNSKNTALVTYTNDGKDSNDQYCGKGWGLPGVCCVSGSIKVHSFTYNLLCNPNPKAIIFGDSITEGTNLGGGTGTYDKWSSQVRDKYYNGNCLICGRGWSTTNDMMLRMKAIHELGIKPQENVIVLIGANDVRGSDEWLEGWKTDMKEKVVPYIKDTFGVDPVICCLTLCQTDTGDRVKKANAWILQQNWKSPRFDKATSANEDGTTYSSQYSTDGLHPNKLGSDRMFAFFKACMTNTEVELPGGGSTAENLTISNIGNLTQTEKTEFYIEYSTNIAVAKHEVSWDGGNTFYDKTTDVESSGTKYRFKHDNGGSAGTYQMAIRVTTAKGTTKTSNIFTVTLEAKTSDDSMTFTQGKKLDNGVVTDTTDNTYYTTVNKIAVTGGKTYTLNISPVNYTCICFYNSSDTYLGNDSGGFVEANTSDWSVGTLSTAFTVPSSASYIRICGTGTNGQVTATIKESSTPTPNPNPSELLDSTGAYVIDDFSSNTIDSNKWSYELGYVRNNETQKYTNTNAEVNDGILALRGLKASDGSWTSASIISKKHFAFMYGKIVARIRACNYNGAFGAFWTLGDSFEFGYKENGNPDTLGEWWAYCGEFDVMEFYNGKLTCGAFFNEKEESGRVWYNDYPTGDWHEFAMEWKTDGTLIFSIDGHELSRTSATDNRAFHIPHFILVNQAIGASGGTPDSSTTEITQYVDWIKYYPLSTDNVVLNSSDFSLTAMDANDSSHNCMVRPTFNDNCINKSLTWESSNSSLVWVHSGLCSTYADANGEVIITATSHSGVSKQITLTVSNGTLREKSSGGSTTPTIGNMTYGKGMDQTTHIIKDDAACWATVDPVTVEQGATYTLQMDGTWVWGYAFDDSDNYVSELFTSSGNNNYKNTFTAPTTKIRYGCYDPGKYLTYCNLTKTSGGGSTTQ
jgi:lysophospholipase L1-like esterase